MKIYIPISTQEKGTKPVLEAVNSLSDDYEYIESSELNKPSHVDAIIRNRIKCIETAVENGDEFIVMSDSRVKHLKDDNLEVMKTFLIDNPDNAGVSMKRNNLSCCMLRVDLYKDYRFDNNINNCECMRLYKYTKTIGLPTFPEMEPAPEAPEEVSEPDSIKLMEKLVEPVEPIEPEEFILKMPIKPAEAEEGDEEYEEHIELMEVYEKEKEEYEEYIGKLNRYNRSIKRYPAKVIRHGHRKKNYRNCYKFGYLEDGRDRIEKLPKTKVA